MVIGQLEVGINAQLDRDRLAHHAHMSACSAVLNFSPTCEILIELQRKFPDVETGILLSQAQISLKLLVNIGAAEFFVNEDGSSRDLSTSEALQEIDNPACWTKCERYLAAAKTPQSTYFASIYTNLRHHVFGDPDWSG